MKCPILTKEEMFLFLKQLLLFAEIEKKINEN